MIRPAGHGRGQLAGAWAPYRRWAVWASGRRVIYDASPDGTRSLRLSGRRWSLTIARGAGR